jgi:hypothetical protein
MRSSRFGILGSLMLAGLSTIGLAPALPALYSGTSLGSPEGLNMGLQAEVEAAAMRNMMGGRRSGWLKHRAPGERAHRRWRHARASGIAGSSRA